MAVGAGDAEQPICENRKLGRKRIAHDRPFTLIRRVEEFACFVADKRAPCPVDATARGRVDKNAVKDVGEAIAGGAVHMPMGGELLMRGVDLFDDEVKRRIAVASAAPSIRVALMYPLEIPGRIVKPVRMIDAKPADLALGGQLDHEPMRGVEHGLAFHAQRGKVADVEKPPVIDLVRCDPPIRDAERLRFQKIVQRGKALGVTRRAVERPHGRFDRVANCRRLARQPRKLDLATLLVAMPLRGSRARRGKIGECGCHAVELGAQRRGKRFVLRPYALEDHLVRARIDRQAVLVIDHRKRARIHLETQLELAALEHPAVRFPQYWHEDFSRERGIDGMPVDVEVTRVDGRLPVFQHVRPPCIVVAHHRHVVGHDVGNVAHSVTLECIDKALEVLAAADLRIEPAVVDDVVAMAASGTRAQIRRAVDVTHAEGVEIGDERGSVGKREVAVELQPVGRARDHELPCALSGIRPASA